MDEACYIPSFDVSRPVSASYLTPRLPEDNVHDLTFT